MEWLIPTILAAIATLVGVALLALGWLKKSRKMRWVGIGLLAAPWVLSIVLSVTLPGIDEWNPVIESDAQVRGAWEGDGHAIELKPEGSFVYSTKDESMRGGWKRDDWNLRLTSDEGQTRRMRFVEDQGQLFLQVDPRGPDHETGPLMKRK